MKIDIHTHTKKCKTGDAPSREILPDEFCKTVLSTDVGIIAITNHNVFDLSQYTEIKTRIGDTVQVWPGIELDINENGARGHLLVIVSPKQAEVFSTVVDELTRGFNPDSFTASIDDILKNFDILGPLYVAHYKKKPDIPDNVLEKLLVKTKYPSHVIKEVSNSISAGIFISHGHASIYGSDVQDWSKYEEDARELPDLRLPVDSYEQFCLLLKKDPTTINTVLDKKIPEEIVLDPFGDDTTLSIRVYNDINIVFGPKGTGKTSILEAIAKYYTKNGINAHVYKPASDRLDEIFDTKGKDLTINLNDHDIIYCTNEIKTLRDAVEVGITSLAEYVAYFRGKSTNRNAKQILLSKIEPEGESETKHEFDDSSIASETTGKYLEFLRKNITVISELTTEEYDQVTRILSELLERLRHREWVSFSSWKEIRFLNSAIEAFRREVQRKTGIPAKPTTAGFHTYAMNRIKIELNAAKIMRNANTTIPIQKERVGNLGIDKGELEFWTQFTFQTGDVTDGSLSSLNNNIKKGTQKKFIKCIRLIRDHAYSDKVFEFISELNCIEDVESIKTVYELLLFKRYFAIDGAAYSPSSGEASMVMLHKELGTNREVYLLDEPERSLGNEYINEMIVPLIRDHARAGKKVFISTHDANIAVRTLPYSSIYRCHGKAGYSTFIGNPFSNNLVNLKSKDDRLDWKLISMKTLEGGEEAFGERGKIYGKD